MGKGRRIKIGLLFSYDENWIGGTYYILNLIHALKKVEDKTKPHLVILCHIKADLEMIQSIGYPYIEFHNTKISWGVRLLNKTSRTFTGKNIFLPALGKNKIDLLFWGNHTSYFRKIKKKLYWIPDFQEHHLPAFFSEQEIKERKFFQQSIGEKKVNILFSSQDAELDFKTIYPSSIATTHVLNFAVTHPEYRSLSLDELLKKYNISKDYFFCPNQFWKHKNHVVILQALAIIKNKHDIDFTVAFSGREYDSRNPEYVNELKQYIKENNLEDGVRFLGFMDRSEQLKLMSGAKAIIQPSLFEGWSTVVEDAKAMNQNVVASNLRVHVEQLSDQGYLFDAHDPQALSSLLMLFLKNNMEQLNYEYDRKVLEFGDGFMHIVQKLLAKPTKIN